MIPIDDIRILRDTLTAHLAANDIDAAADLLATTAIETGGTVHFCNPDAHRQINSHARIHGLYAEDTDLEAMIRSWIKLASNAVDPDDDGMVTVYASATDDHLAFAWEIAKDEARPDSQRLDAANAIIAASRAGTTAHGRASDLARLIRTEMDTMAENAA